MKTILGLSQWEIRIADVFSSTICFKSTQAEHLERVTKTIYSELNRCHGTRAVYSNYIKGFVYGYMRACDSAMMRDKIEFCYIVDGTMYSVWRESTHKTTRDYCEKINPESGGAVLCRDDTERGLFWRGTDKRFF